MIVHQKVCRMLGLCLLLSVSMINCVKIHELMTEEELQSVFRASNVTVLEYEVVLIEHSLHKRSAPKDFRLRFKAFEKDVDLYLQPTEGILVGEDTPVWIAEYTKGRLRYRRLEKEIMKEVLGVYQSVPGRAALVVSARKDENLKFDGTVEDLTVVPLPARVQSEIEKTARHKRDLPSTGRSMTSTGYHLVFKSNKVITRANTTQQSSETTPDASESLTSQIDVARSKRADKAYVFPTILVTTDFDLPVKSHDDSQFYDQIIYQLAFWNAVDLRYRGLSNPKVRLRIAGFIIGSGRQATPYLQRHTINGEVEIYPAIDAMRTYWDRMRTNGDFSSEGFHVVTTATNSKLFGIDKSGVKKTYGGLTRISSLCDYYDEGFYPSVIFNDDNGFGGINIAVHELAHVLGAYHDRGTNGECAPEDGYLMSPTTSATENNPMWSKCSLARLSDTLRTNHCADKPKDHYPPGKPLDKILPGSLKSAMEQCQARGFDWACETTPDICRILKCYYSGFYGFFTTLLKCQDSASAAEGTQCAPGRCDYRGCRFAWMESVGPWIHPRTIEVTDKTDNPTDVECNRVQCFYLDLTK